MSNMSATRVRNQRYKNDTSVTQKKNFDFDIYYMVSERLQGDEQFHFQN